MNSFIVSAEMRTLNRISLMFSSFNQQHFSQPKLEDTEWESDRKEEEDTSADVARLFIASCFRWNILVNLLKCSFITAGSKVCQVCEVALLAQKNIFSKFMS